MKRSHIFIILPIILLVIGIFGYLYYTQNAQVEPQKSVSSLEMKDFTISNLAQFDGKYGNKCYVGIDTKVYDMSGSNLWKNGEHISSRGQAKCGLDLTAVIAKSPHGRSVLKDSLLVGNLKT